MVRDKYVFSLITSAYKIYEDKNTIDAIPTVDDTLYNLQQPGAKVNGITGYYHGYKVFRDDTLEFGEVEIR